MRILLIFSVMFFAITLKAQIASLGGFQNDAYSNSLISNNHIYDCNASKKWFITRSTGITAGYGFSRPGGASFIAAPFSLQLNHRLSNNLYAFAGITAAPAYLSFNRAFLTTDLNKVNTFNSFYQPGNFSMYSAATLGLMYINNEKTFSVSGSISVERNDYPLYYNNRLNTTKSNSTVPFAR